MTLLPDPALRAQGREEASNRYRGTGEGNHIVPNRNGDPLQLQEREVGSDGISTPKETSGRIAENERN